MKNENMLLYANFASNGSVNQPLPVGLLLLTYRQLLSAAACSSFVECRVPSPLDPFFLPLWPPAASEKRRERCTLAQKDRQTHGRTSNSMTTAAPPSFLLSLSPSFSLSLPLIPKTTVGPRPRPILPKLQLHHFHPRLRDKC